MIWMCACKCSTYTGWTFYIPLITCFNSNSEQHFFYDFWNSYTSCTYIGITNCPFKWWMDIFFLHCLYLTTVWIFLLLQLSGDMLCNTQVLILPQNNLWIIGVPQNVCRSILNKKFRRRYWKRKPSRNAVKYRGGAAW